MAADLPVDAYSVPTFIFAGSAACAGISRMLLPKANAAIKIFRMSLSHPFYLVWFIARLKLMA
jgi:hypothetical protein